MTSSSTDAPRSPEGRQRGQAYQAKAEGGKGRGEEAGLGSLSQSAMAGGVWGGACSATYNRSVARGKANRVRCVGCRWSSR